MDSEKVEQRRNLINQLDEIIVEAIAKRCELSKQIGVYKKKRGLLVFDREREDVLYANYKNLSNKYNLDRKFIMKIFSLIVSHSREIQEIVKDGR